VVKDEVYFNDTVQGTYVPLDSALYEKIQAKAFRL